MNQTLKRTFTEVTKGRNLVIGQTMQGSQALPDLILVLPSGLPSCPVKRFLWASALVETLHVSCARA